MVIFNNNTTKQSISSSVKHSIIYLSLLPVLVIALVVWFSKHRIDDFKNSQISVATSVVNSVAQETARLIKDNKRLLSIFVENERSNIQNLATDTSNEEYKKLLTRKMNAYFPELFTFTIVDRTGIPIIDDFDGHIGDICLEDIKLFSTTGKQNIRVHPNPYVYHTDSIARINKEREAGFFFASFKTNVFSRLLKLSSPNNQSLMLVNTQIPDLIEIAEIGARIKLNRDSYILTASEKARILFSMPIKGTHWRLVSLHDEALFNDYQYEVFTIGFCIVLIFIMAITLIVVGLWRREQQRLIIKKAKEEVFAFFSHELRAPLNSIYGTVQLLQINSSMHGFDEDTHKMVVSAVENSENMISLINDLLDVQKLESGMMRFDFKKTEINGLIKEIIDLNMRLAAMRNIKMEFTPTQELYLNIDKQRFQQLLTNLLSNAIKYSPTNDVVTISLSEDGVNGIITVADNGPGISSDIKDTVFEKFTQSNSKTTKAVGGTGLGLALVKFIVEEHGGIVEFESSHGKGTRFIIKLPLVN